MSRDHRTRSATGRHPGAGGREGFLRELAMVPGVYVPSMYDVDYDGAAIAEIRPRFADVPAIVDKRTVADLADWPYPSRPLVPLTEVVHDRLSVEVFRGCTRGCRFCQAGMITRPVRERPAEQVRTMIRDGLRRTGYDEVSLTSLSTADFSDIEPVIKGVLADQARRVVRRHAHDQPAVVAGRRVHRRARRRGPAVRRSGLTFAPEAGSWRLRQVINKLITEEDLYGAVDSAFSQGWRAGEAVLPHRAPHRDRRGHARHRRAGQQLRRDRQAAHRRASCHRVVGGYVPKPHTPFQWFGQNTVDELQRKINMLRDDAAPRARSSSGARPEASVAEGIAYAWRSAHRPRDRAGVAGGRRVPGMGRALRPQPVAGRHGRRGLSTRLVRDIATATSTRCCRGLTSPPDCITTSSGTTGRTHSPARVRGLPVDAVLRLWCVHRLRHRTRGGVAGRRRRVAARAPARTSPVAARCRSCSSGCPAR